MSKRPRLQLPYALPWDAMGRLMDAYAAECRAILKRPGHPQGDEWSREAKRAQNAARNYRGLHRVDPREPVAWPREEDD